MNDTINMANTMAAQRTIRGECCEIRYPALRANTTKKVNKRLGRTIMS
jgi:hypothetical protein